MWLISCYLDVRLEGAPQSWSRDQIVDEINERGPLCTGYRLDQHLQLASELGENILDVSGASDTDR